MVMRRIIPDALVGAFAGFALGGLVAISLAAPGLTPERAPYDPFTFGLAGAAVGAALGTLLRIAEHPVTRLARWCVAMAALFGIVGLLAAYAGPTDGLPGGLALAGPFGVMLGAVAGLA